MKHRIIRSREKANNLSTLFESFHCHRKRSVITSTWQTSGKLSPNKQTWKNHNMGIAKPVTNHDAQDQSKRTLDMRDATTSFMTISSSREISQDEHASYTLRTCSAL